MKKLLSPLPPFGHRHNHQHHRNVDNHKYKNTESCRVEFLDVCDCQHFDDTGDDDGCDDDFDDTGNNDGTDDDVDNTGGDDGGHIVDIDQHQLDGGSGTLSYGGNNEDDSQS